MPEVICEQLVDPTIKDIADVLNLFRKIKGRTCTAANYYKFIDLYWSHIAFFVARKGDTIVGFTQAQEPGLLEPTIGYLPFSCSSKECGHENAKKGVEMAEQWMKERGAKSWRMTTVRTVKAMKKLWGISACKEILMEKVLE